MRKTVDLVVVSLILLGSALVWYIFDLKPLVGGGILFMFLPVVYLGIRGRKPWQAILGGSITLGFLLGFFFDLIQSYNGAWSVDRILILWKILGIMPIDNALGDFFMTLFTLVFYEHFFAGRTEIVLPIRFYKITGVIVLILAVTLSLAFWNRTLLYIPYSYVVGGILAALVTLRAGFRHRELLPALTGMAVYFFFVCFLAELVAVSTGGWSYPGTQYLGWVEIGSIRYPIEELLFWMMWYAPFLVLGYEYLIRNKKGIDKTLTTVLG
jgi:hypothetical protein